MQTAIVLANGYYQTPNGKVAHGLVRGSDRFSISALIDPLLAGQDAGVALDGEHRGIPIVASIEAAVALSAEPPEFCIIGIATHGGHLDTDMRKLVLEAVEAGMSIVNGLHDATAEVPEVSSAAERRGVELIDLRRPKRKRELHFWEGAIHRVRAPRLAVLGTDCALGKRTTTRLLVACLNDNGIKAQMLYTGQTGWMQGAGYGFVLDSTLNDYVSGELEHAIVACDRETSPDLIVIEGQSSLRNPSGPCGAEFLLSGAAHGVVLQHAPQRVYFEGYEDLELRIPSLESEVELIGLYGARTLAITLNGQGASAEALARFRRDYEAQLDIPVMNPLEEGLSRVVPAVRAYIDAERARVAN